MPAIRPIPAVTFAAQPGRDLSSRIAPPYDVLDEAGKAALLKVDPQNIVAIDLPHLPAKTVGPDATYDAAGELYRQWLREGVMVRRKSPVLVAYQQTYTHAGRRFQRRGLIANVTIQPFGKSPDGKGGIHPHEQTFSGPKEDRMKLMRATKAQLSPIFGLHSDPSNRVHALLTKVIESRPADLAGTTSGDGVSHEGWVIETPAEQKPFLDHFAGADIFIADGHHRYTTALNYRGALAAAGPLAPDHPANFCLFVLVAMQDPGMIVLPTHRVLGSMAEFTLAKFTAAAAGKLKITPFAGKGSPNDLAALEAALPKAGPHAIGLFCPSNPAGPLAIATTVAVDPLAATHAKQSPAWRQLDVAIVQHLIVEGICQPTFCPQGAAVSWKFPHTLAEFERDTTTPGYQLGLLLQPTPLESVRLVSQAGELMPQKSTFFYPKLATGMIVNPLE
ncbi:MAG: DUF1015 domain-containing protein [Planctomycetota bacterium]|nr:DUF1015 domain-containing protein [Planctomycetota bacterium]